eukprot:2825554-Prymnesium_polylepis.1
MRLRKRNSDGRPEASFACGWQHHSHQRAQVHRIIRHAPPMPPGSRSLRPEVHAGETQRKHKCLRTRAVVSSAHVLVVYCCHECQSRVAIMSSADTPRESTN